ncbi:MAG: protein translocase subunit SecD [Actinomycetales bacterium]|nr:protein translocase subunit SecD [Actinomycetales bacterium]
MSVSGVTKSARKRLIWLGALILSIAGLVGAGVATGSGATLTPKLALDLEGGTSIILSPLVAEGQKITAQQLEQAVGIIRQRVDSTGVSEAQITTSGSNNIVVSIPGTPDDNTLKLIRSSAKLEFRPVILASSGASASVGGSGSSATPSAKPSVQAKPTDASDANWVTPAVQAQFDALDCTKQFRTPGQIDDPTLPLVTCDSNGYSKYVLGPVEISGEDIKNATNGTTTTSTGASTNTWAVNLSFNDAGAKKFSAVTSRLYPLTDPRNRFAVTLDGYVITAPTTNAVITNGDAQITGNFDQVSSKSLADSLKYGSLPISFQVQSQENISATLGSEQLASGLLAGIIGLLLVVIYSFFQYRGLALVTVGSLVIAAVLTYVVIVFLSWRNGFRLSLSGVAGLIVAIGITADSFIVYFERVRDELRDGRPLNAAVEAGWKRALRTILVSDGVSLLAAVTLFVLTVGSVKGFAFTLGLTTLIDVAVVMLFTHPMLQLLAQTRFFSSGHPWSGFDSQSLGAGYRGRLEFKSSERISATKKAKSSKEAAKRQTLAERKAAADNEGSN